MKWNVPLAMEEWKAFKKKMGELFTPEQSRSVLIKENWRVVVHSKIHVWNRTAPNWQPWSDQSTPDNIVNKHIPNQNSFKKLHQMYNYPFSKECRQCGTWRPHWVEYPFFCPLHFKLQPADLVWESTKTSSLYDFPSAHYHKHPVDQITICSSK